MLYKYAKSIAMTVFAVFAGAVVHAQSVEATIKLPGLPEQVAVDSVADRIYVAVPNFGAKPYDYLSVIDGETQRVIQNIKIPPVAYAVAVDTYDGLVYVGGSYQDSEGVTRSEVVIVNPQTGRAFQKIAISTTPGDGIQGLAVDGLTGDVYVTNASDNEVDVIHLFELTERIPTSGEPFGVAVNPSLNLIYVALLNGNISIIKGKTHTITSTTPVGTIDAGIAVDTSTGDVFATNSVGFPSQGTVGVLDKVGDLQTTVPVGNFPLGIDVDVKTSLVFVANTGDNTVTVFNGKTKEVKKTLPVSALFLAAYPNRKKVYVAPATNTPVLTVILEN